MTKARIDFLRDISVLKGVEDNLLEYILKITKVITIKKDEFFFREGDKGNCLFIIEKGKVAILKTWQNRDYLLKNLERGDCFGEMALMDLYPRSASALAVEDCTAIRLTTDNFLEIYKKDLGQFTTIFMNIGREVSKRLRDADSRLFQAKVEATHIGKDYVFHYV